MRHLWILVAFAAFAFPVAALAQEEGLDLSKAIEEAEADAAEQLKEMEADAGGTPTFEEMLRSMPEPEPYRPPSEIPRFRPFGWVDNFELSLGYGRSPRGVQTISPTRENIVEGTNYWTQVSPYFFRTQLPAVGQVRISPRYNGNGADFSTKAGYEGDVRTHAGGITVLRDMDGAQGKLAIDYGDRKDTGSHPSAASYRIKERTSRWAYEGIYTRFQEGRISLFQLWVRGEHAPAGKRTSSYISSTGKRVSLAGIDNAVNRSNVTFGTLAEFYQTANQEVTVALSFEAGEVREEHAVNTITSLRFRFFGHLDIASYNRRVQGGDHSWGVWASVNIWEF